MTYKILWCYVIKRKLENLEKIYVSIGRACCLSTYTNALFIPFSTCLYGAFFIKNDMDSAIKF